MIDIDYFRTVYSYEQIFRKGVHQFRPTSWMKSHVVLAAMACASIHAFNGPPIMELNGIACNALVATCEGALLIAIIF